MLPGASPCLELSYQVGAVQHQPFDWSSTDWRRGGGRVRRSEYWERNVEINQRTLRGFPSLNHLKKKCHLHYCRRSRISEQGKTHLPFVYRTFLFQSLVFGAFPGMVSFHLTPQVSHVGGKKSAASGWGTDETNDYEKSLWGQSWFSIIIRSSCSSGACSSFCPFLLVLIVLAAVDDQRWDVSNRMRVDLRHVGPVSNNNSFLNTLCFGSSQVLTQLQALSTHWGTYGMFLWSHGTAIRSYGVKEWSPSNCSDLQMWWSQGSTAVVYQKRLLQMWTSRCNGSGQVGPSTQKSSLRGW